MAGDWIKMRSNLATDPDVVAIAAQLGMEEFQIVGRLHTLWAWADQHSEDGNLPRATSAFLDRLTACPEFANALRGVGWLEGRDSALRLPHWDRHNGSTAKARAVDARKKQMQRSGTNVPIGVPNEPGPEKRREEGEIEEEGRARTRPAEIPPEIPTSGEIVSFGGTAGIPPDYCERYHAKTSETHGWITAHNRLLDWKKRLPRYWSEDRAGWGNGVHRNGQKPARRDANI